MNGVSFKGAYPARVFFIMINFSKVILVMMVVVVAGCAPPLHDRAGQLTREDFRALTTPRAASVAPVPPIPPLEEPLALPAAPERDVGPRITVDAGAGVPVAELLHQMARKADVDLDLAPGVTGSVTIRARNRPLGEVVARIARMADLRYSLEDGVLRVGPDTAVLRTYRVDYLNTVRTAASGTNLSTEIFQTVSEEGSAGDTANGSTATVASQGRQAFWQELAVALLQILARNADTETAPDPVLTEDGEALAGTLGAGGAHFSLNRQAGLVAVYAPQRTQQAVARYLDSLRRKSQAQVLIEAKVVEVTLNEAFQSGINWNTVLDVGNGALTVLGAVPALEGPDDDFFSFTYSGGGQGAANELVRLLERFGTTRTLSSPRVTVMNNQSALLKVASNQVYFKVDFAIETNADGDISQTVATSEIRDVPEGVMMTVQPAIDLARRRINLAIRPTITRIVDWRADPAVDYMVQRAQADTNSLSLPEIKSLIPVLEVRELDSVLALQSGDVAVLGGLMHQRVMAEDEGLPGIMNVPVAGNLFKKNDDRLETVELVIFLQATLVETGADTLAPADRHLYQNYMRDPRPLSL